MQAERYFLPKDHRLRPYVAGIWRHQGGPAGGHERIMPRGVVKLLFPLFGTLTAVDGIRGDVPRLRGAVYLAGLHSHSVTTAPDGPLVMLGLGLSAEACRAVLPLPARHVISGSMPNSPAVAASTRSSWATCPKWSVLSRGL